MLPHTAADPRPSPAPAPSERDTRDERFSLPAITLPQGGGAIRRIDERFEVNAANGTATFSLPLPVSPGRGGAQPTLALSYNSGAGNGPFGLGWSVDVASIARKTDRELPRYRDEPGGDTFVLTGLEDLVPALDAAGAFVTAALPDEGGEVHHVRRYYPRTEGGFARIERWEHAGTGEVHWRSTTAQNVTSIFGRTPAARLADPDDPARVFRWLLELTYDDRGNCTRYEYKAEDLAGVPDAPYEAGRHDGRAPFANRYLKRVLYGNRTPYAFGGAVPGDDDFMFQVVFDYGEHDHTETLVDLGDGRFRYDADPQPGDAGAWAAREDAFSWYRAGFDLRTYRRCRRVLLFHHFDALELVRSLDFTYAANTESGFSVLAAATVRGYLRDGAGYTCKALPALTFTYQTHAWDDTVRTVDAESLDGAPAGLDAPGYQLADLFSEGLPGILSEHGTGWFYKRNLGEGAFAPPEQVAPRPSFDDVGTTVQVQDLRSDGTRALVSLQAEPRGFFALTLAEEWEPFRPFEHLPNVDFSDPNAKLIDVTGDGMADLLITEDHALVWYPSAGEAGWDAPHIVRLLHDEDRAPAVIFADADQSIYLADMSGDGLADIVRLRNGEACYWPNLGYGRFGAKVVMANAPHFDAPDRFNPRYVYLADVDGSGTTDVLYLGRGDCRIWLNQGGNAWSAAPRVVATFPGVDAVTSGRAADLLGTGTTCLVWSSPLPADAGASLRYIDLMGGRKPHLLAGYRNGMGLEVRLEYAASTRFYLADRQAGTPWATKLPFPVQVVTRTETRDHVAGTEFVTAYSYHHGYYDTVEREFRGFGRVDQLDTETYDHFVLREAANVVEEDLHQPPVLTRTWYHTGAYFDHEPLHAQFAREVYAGAAEHRLPDPILPDGLTAEEARQAARALKGRVLRREVHAQDGTLLADVPYITAQTSYVVRRVQPQGENRYAVFLVSEAESITYHTERGADQPRVSHTLNLEIDEFGNVVRAASVGYGRGFDDPALPAAVRDDQNQRRVVLTETDYSNDVMTATAYRLRVPVEVRTFELTGVVPEDDCFRRDELADAAQDAAPIPYETAPDGSAQRRLIEQTRTFFYTDDGATALPLGAIEARALVRQGLTLAFTPDLLADLYGARVTDAMLAEGGYVHSEGDANWWAPTHRVEYGTPFLLPVRLVSPFGDAASVTYDAHHLLVEAATDFVGNVTSVENDYRILGPALQTSPNLNREAVAADELGFVVGHAVMGKAGAGEGDTLADPTTRYSYDLTRWAASGLPNRVRVERKERHGAAPPVQVSFEYTDGGGNLVMTKHQAEPGLARVLDDAGTVVEVDTTPDLRWIGSGRTIVNNKGNPVKQYEPYFSTTPEYESEAALVQVGVTALRTYDPLGREVRVDHPDGTFERIAFTPWLVLRYDRNDTVRDSAWYAALGSPDPDADPEPAAPDVRAAWLAARHADTPTREYFDALGRAVYTVVDDGAGGLFGTRSVLDVEGDQLAAIDARGNTIMAYRYSIGGVRGTQISADGGERRTFQDVLGAAIYAWDSRGHRLRTEYDALQRATHQWLQVDGDPEILIARTIYGDAAEAPADAVDRNLRGQVYRVFDQSGLVTSERYDFKGNLTHTTRRLAADFEGVINWDVADPLALLEAESFETRTAFDALSRPVEIRTPHNAAIPASVIEPGYDAAGLLTRVDVRLRGAGAPTNYVARIDYDARGQRERIEYGSGVVTTYTYDPLTLRLTTLHTTRQRGTTEDLQLLRYTYDPVGNVTQIRDDALQTVYFNGAAVPPEMRFEVNALYRLTVAHGREHIGQNAPPAPGDGFRRHLPHPGDSSAMRRYRQSFEYDAVGNLLSIVHHAGNGTFVEQWTQAYTIAAGNNHLLQTTVGGATFNYTYDAHGNMLPPHLDETEWDFNDRLRHVRRGTSEAFFVYDAQGQRVRKVIRRNGLREDRLYLGGFELFRRVTTATNTVRLQRETLHIMDDERRIALVETKTIDLDDPGSVPETLHRYQHDNHLQSAALELDQAGDVISYEEYYPFGATAYQAGRTQAEVQRKRYRYAGREQDEVTGLYHMGARYYAPWLGRWTAPDPAGLVDGLNLYRYARNNPLRLSDRRGTDPDDEVSFGAVRLTDIRLRTDVIPVGGRLQFQNLLDPNRSVTGNLTLGARLDFRARLHLDTGPDICATSDTELFPLPWEAVQRVRASRDPGTPVRADAAAVLRLDTDAGRASATGRAFGLVGTVGEGIWASASASGSFEAPIPNRLYFRDIGSTLRSSLSEASGEVRFSGAVQAPGLTLGTLSGSATLAPGGSLRLRADLATIGDLAEFKLRGTGQLREGGVDIGATGQLSLFGIPSLRLAGTGAIEYSGEYRFEGAASGYVPPLTYAFGRFSLTSGEGFSGSAHLFGLTYLPGVDAPRDPSPLPGIVRQQYNLPDDLKVPSGPALGYSYFGYSRGRLTSFGVGLVPQTSGLSLGATLTVPFDLPHR